MATYTISDIHGADKKFYKMLKKINIDLTKDILIINGDILDRGKNSLKLFYEIYDMQQEYGLDHLIINKGNHELFLERYLQGILPKSIYSSQAYGGVDTIREAEKLSEEEKRSLIEILSSLPIYTVVFSEKRGEDIVVCHTGPHYNFIRNNPDGTVNVIESIKASYEWNENDFLINGFIQREAPAGLLKSLDHVLCVGHVPTIFLPEIQAPVITAMHGNRVILTDTGAGHGERLGCLKFGDEATFYV